MDQANTGQDPTSTAVLADKAFVRKALEGGMTEIQLGQLALQKSSNDDVKQFAQKMIDDHTKLGDEMKQVGQQMGIKAPDSPSSKDKSAMAKLQALSGDDFDKAYIKDMVKDHQQDAKDFKQEAQTTTNPALKSVVVQGQQVIDEHLQMIQQIAQKNNVVASK
jgi:putative membrane protein